jgi:hypothetical protein
VLNQHYALPGIGSYVAAAIDQASLGRVGIAVMTVMVIAVNFVFWRPMVAWAERFRAKESAAAERPRSVVLDVLRRSVLPDLGGHGGTRQPAPRPPERAAAAPPNAGITPPGIPGPGQPGSQAWATVVPAGLR